jgi:hypothetical protein
MTQQSLVCITFGTRLSSSEPGTGTQPNVFRSLLCQAQPLNKFKRVSVCRRYGKQAMHRYYTVIILYHALPLPILYRYCTVLLPVQMYPFHPLRCLVYVLKHLPTYRGARYHILPGSKSRVRGYVLVNRSISLMWPYRASEFPCLSHLLLRVRCMLLTTIVTPLHTIRQYAKTLKCSFLHCDPCMAPTNVHPHDMYTSGIMHTYLGYRTSA